MVPADDDHKDTPEVDSSTSTKERKSGQLTPMPDYLMHWLTPVLFAVILLAAGCFLASIWRMPLRLVSWQTINPFWPPSWPFNYHWPSKDAMALCATIAGAGFAFSAWQQRSHDNIAREKDALTKQEAEKTARETAERNRRAQIERDEYWKRREQIYQLLGSKNPGLRLGAVALLAELADSAAHSSFLNETEKQQLQRHIIDTLCLQVRHEGFLLPNEGDKHDHTEVQKAILQSIIIRINSPSKQTPHADWSTYPINLTNCTLLTSIRITNTVSSATLDFSDSIFHKPVAITDSTLSKVQWSTAHFHDSLTVFGQTNNCNIHIDNLPADAPKIAVSNSIIYLSTNDLHIDIKNFEQGIVAPEITLERCSFFTQNETKAPDQNSYQPFPELRISTNAEHINTIDSPRHVFIKECSFSNIDIISTNPETIVSISKCAIQRSLYITFERGAEMYTNPSSQNNFHILIYQNTFSTPANTIPIHIANRSETDIKTALLFSQNTILRNKDSNRIEILDISTDVTNSEPIHFIEETKYNQPVFSWKTGGPDSLLHLSWFRLHK